MAERTISEYITSGTPISEEDLPAAYQATEDYNRGARGAFFNEGMALNWGGEAQASARALADLQRSGAYKDIRKPEAQSAYWDFYDKHLKEINDQQAKFTKENPWTAAGLEGAGAMLPAVATFGTSQLHNVRAVGALAKFAEMAAPYAKSALTGLVSGGISGAGAAEPEKRMEGAETGAKIGIGMGLGVPAVMRGAGAAANALGVEGALNKVREFFGKPKGQKEAARMLSEAFDSGDLARGAGDKSIAGLQNAKDTLRKKFLDDREAGVYDSSLMNMDDDLLQLGKKLAGGNRKGAKILQAEADAYSDKAVEKTSERLRKELGVTGDYDPTMKTMIASRRAEAPGMYDEVYQHGDILDPRIAKLLEDKDFAAAFNRAKIINEKKAGTAVRNEEDPSRFQLKEIYKIVNNEDGTIKDFKLVDVPDLRTLDLVKRELDAKIRGMYRGAGADPTYASALKEQRDDLVKYMDQATMDPKTGISKYAETRKRYGDRMELEESAEIGMDDFQKLRHTQVEELMGSLSDPGKNAFRLGVANNRTQKMLDAADKNVSPASFVSGMSNDLKLRSLFESDEKFKVYQYAQMRDLQLHDEWREVVSAIGSRSENTPSGAKAMGQAAMQTLKGNPKAAALTIGADAMLAVQNPAMTNEVAAEIAKHLMSKEPKEVAAAVKLIEDYRKGVASGEAFKGNAERAVTSGAMGSFWPRSSSEQKTSDQLMEEVKSNKYEYSPSDEQYLKEFRKKRMGEE